MNAVILRYILLGVLVLMLLGLGAGGWWLQDTLTAKMRETDHARIDAELSQQEVEYLKQLKERLAQQKDIVERTKQIAATADQYGYQDQVVGDISTYARRHGITISSFDFSAAGQKTDAAKTPFAVTLKGPLAYITFLRFLQDIEKNLTKIQVTSLALSPDTKNPNNITNPTVGLEVYLKK
ncbi:MAG: type 4a pilus biogenesis protein PilO [Candidatus Saccharimonadales bacterium]